MLPFDLQHGTFVFRFERVGGVTRVWCQFDDCAELGPAELTPAELTEMHEHIHRIVDVVSTAIMRPSESEQRLEASSPDAEPPPASGTTNTAPDGPGTPRTTSSAPTQQLPARPRKPN